MKLKKYLADRKESHNQFAKRSGVPSSVVGRICDDDDPADPRASTVQKIIHATGGLVSLDDLVPERERRKRRRPSMAEAA